MEFEIAKKLNKPSSLLPGVSLRSIDSQDDGFRMVIVAGSYTEIKSSVESYRLMHSVQINYRARGKSLEIYTAELQPLVDFARGISFNTEDALDCIEYLAGNLPVEGAELLSVHVDQSQLSLKLDAEDIDKVQAEIMPDLDKYNMGVVR